MKYFQTCQTLEEVKTLYRELAKQFHPDLNPDGKEVMQEINNEYEFACAKVLQDVKDSSSKFDAAMMFREKIDQIINLPGIQIEIVGAWLWITGKTREVKEELKNLEFRFAPKKIAWYWFPEGFESRGSGKSLDQIRAKYGSEVIRKREEERKNLLK